MWLPPPAAASVYPRNTVATTWICTGAAHRATNGSPHSEPYAGGTGAKRAPDREVGPPAFLEVPHEQPLPQPDQRGHQPEHRSKPCPGARLQRLPPAVYDGGVDFILYRESDGELRKVQLKSRWTIDRKYEHRDIWIAFPIGDDWYLIPHDVMVASAKADGIIETASWMNDGSYSRPRPSAVLTVACAPYRFAAIAEVASKAAEEAA